MSFKLILRIQGFLLTFLAGTMALPLAIALIYGEACYLSFAYAAVITLVSGMCLLLVCPASTKSINQREGLLIVGLGWIASALFGCLPFIFNATFVSFTDAVFETVSGFTTTGATVLANIEILPRSILFWRSMIQWLGGMGIILFSIAILPLLGIGGMQLYKAETTGPVHEKLKPRIVETARALWKVYILLTLAQIVLLLVCGMDLYDAVCHTFTTVSTGGFSTRNLSIEAFNSPAIETVIMLFMFAGGISFALHYRMLHGRMRSMFEDRECLFYCGLTMTAALSVSLIIASPSHDSFWTALRHGAFQTISILTTTGYSSADYAQWPLPAAFIVLLLMFIGGCAGSTAGGMKCIRVLITFKRCYRDFFLAVHPHAVSSIKIGIKPVSESVVSGLSGFVLLYILIFCAGSLALSFSGLDFITAVSAAASALGNVGPGLGDVGPYNNFLFMTVSAKWLLIMLMLIGRLEMFTILMLFLPAFWKR